MGQQQKQKQQQPSITYEQVYRNFNQNDTNMKASFEMIYNRCQELEAILANITPQYNQLVQEKQELSKINHQSSKPKTKPRKK